MCKIIIDGKTVNSITSINIGDSCRAGVNDFNKRLCSLISNYIPIEKSKIEKVLDLVESIDKTIALIIIAKSMNIDIIDLAMENKAK